MSLLSHVAGELFKAGLDKMFSEQEYKELSELYGDATDFAEVQLFHNKKPGVFTSWEEATLIILERGVVLTYMKGVIPILGKRITVGLNYQDENITEYQWRSNRICIKLQSDGQEYNLVQVRVRPNGGDIRELCKLT